MADFDTALEYHTKVLNISENLLKTLTWYQKMFPNIGKKQEYLILGSTYNDIAHNYNNRGEYSKALEYYEKALSIIKKYQAK